MPFFGGESVVAIEAQPLCQGAGDLPGRAVLLINLDGGLLSRGLLEA